MFKLRKYPDPILRKIAMPVAKFDKHLGNIVDEMFCTMYENNGVGLAAPQIGINWQVFIINCDNKRSQQKEMTFVNPKIVSFSEEIQNGDEGCLSFPNVFKPKVRPKSVTISALNVLGAEFTVTLNDLEARAVLHEYEHLNGILLID